MFILQVGLDRLAYTLVQHRVVNLYLAGRPRPPCIHTCNSFWSNIFILQVGLDRLAYTLVQHRVVNLYLAGRPRPNPTPTL